MAKTDWQASTLGEFVTLQRGIDLPETNRIPGNVPVLGSFGITGYHNESKSKGPGVTVGRSGGSFGVVTYSAVDYWPLNTALYVKDFHGNDEKFAYYFLKTMDFKRFNSGSAQPSLNRNYIHPIPVKIPRLSEQCAIAHILGTLDDKIELNRRMSETLEAMARTLFKSWFVDFDPVRAKAEGRQPEGLDVDTAALFPDAFEDSPLRKIPQGWRVDGLGNVIELAYGKALKEENRRRGDIPVFGSNGQVGWHDEKLVDGPGIVVGRKGNPGIVTWSQTDFFPIDTAFYVVAKDQDLSLHYLFHSLRELDLASLGADSAVPGLNRNIAYMSKITVPPYNILKLFDNHAMGFNEMVQANIVQSRTLAAIRDALLPKLLSGEVRIRDAEKWLEAPR
jgi:type I restriction enzyme, S subunit